MRPIQCHIGYLLRYALFSFSPERSSSPCYSQRFEILRQLAGTFYLEQPLWLFDYAMLAFQTGEYQISAESFARLRRGQRFFLVPMERTCALSNPAQPTHSQKVRIRVTNLSPNTDKGWAKIEYPLEFNEFNDPVPFSRRSFESRNQVPRLGASILCTILLRPSGPFAEPL